ncbi:MAG: MBL fold metallo-hydrolase [Rickettsiales bacterium]|jgi:phosphoribosyl 1,2-cyclic phosphate phosphodiesterase
MKITVLGCGHSLGVPVIGCDCAVCTSKNPKNKRLRVSVFIEINGMNIIIDTSPDFRQQMLLENINKLDAVLYTHDHADHTHGLDDLRQFNVLQGDVIPVYSNAEILASLQKRFAYAFLPKPVENAMFRPSLVSNILPDVENHEFMIGDTKIIAFKQQHGKNSTLGYRIGDFAYSTDVNVLSEAAFQALDGVKYWVVDCLRYTPSYSHSHLERTLEWVERVKPEQAILTHMAHEFDYDTLSAELPTGVFAGYDGMVLEI